jgi:TPR repeat protein
MMNLYLEEALQYSKKYGLTSIILSATHHHPTAGKDMDKYLKIVFCLVFIIATKAQADFVSAVKNYNERKFPEAMLEFQRTAALGHKQSQLNIGVMYFRGEGATKNIVDAYAWTALSAEDGNADSLRTRDLIFTKMNAQQKIDADVKLKELMSSHSNQTLNSTLYPKYSKEKVELTYAHFKSMPQAPRSVISEQFSKYELEYDVDPQGYIHNYTLLDGEGVKDPDKLINYLASLRKSPQRLDGQPIWVYNLKYKLIHVGRGRAKQITDEVNEEIREGFSPEIDWANPENLYQHAFRINDFDTSKKMQQYKKLLMLSAAQMGHSQAQLAIALNIIYGKNFERDRQKALTWLLAVENSNDSSSLYLAASLLYDGKVVDSNKSKAVEFLQQAAEQQHTKSKVKLAWILATEKEAEFFNPPKALQLITETYSNYLDRITAYETLAAAQAANGKFDDAISAQTFALNFAKEIDAKLEDAKARLTSYQQHQAWRQ